MFRHVLFYETFTGRHRHGRLVSWVEKGSLERIRLLLEITEGERNHELLLSVKILRELGVSPFPYKVPVIPRSLPEELEVNILSSPTFYSRSRAAPHKQGMPRSLRLRSLKEPWLALPSQINRLWPSKTQIFPPGLPRRRRKRRREKSQPGRSRPLEQD